jgi:hypothetical protein
VTDELRAALRATLAEIPAVQAENDGWPEKAMPGMLAALGLEVTPVVSWFAAGTSPLYDAAVPLEDGGWRYCHAADDPQGPDLLGIAYGGTPPRLYLRADVSLPRAIHTLGHELYHLAEFAAQRPADEQAADAFGAQAAARFWAAQYR